MKGLGRAVMQRVKFLRPVIYVCLMIVFSLNWIVRKFIYCKRDNMDWLLNLAILLVVGCFTLRLSGKIKNNQMSHILPRYITQRDKAKTEKESQELIKREFSHEVPTYETLRSNENPGFTGFLYYYLWYTRNDETLTTTAKSEIIKTLSENDLLRDLKLFFTRCSISTDIPFLKIFDFARLQRKK